MSKTLQVIVVCLVAAVSFATAKPAYVYAPGVPVDTPEVAAAKAAHFAAHAVARTGLIHPYYAGHVPLALPYIAHAVADQTGAYVHDPSGDVAVPYIHDLSGEYAPAYAYAVPGAYAAPVIVNGVPADTPEVAAAKAAHLAAHAALG